jgi:LuxR family transcriptional regulator, maltose regulon positive regulatory protein
MVEGARAKREPIRTPHPSQVVFDYFAAEVFADADPVTQDVLLQTAFLPRVTAEMANALTRSKTAGRVLEELHRGNYFTNRYLANGQPEGEAAYQYHPLFRAFLLRRSHDVLSPECRTAIQRACAKLLEDAGQVEDAADLLAETHDWDGLARLVCQHAGGFCEVGRNRTVAAWIQRLPADRVEMDPWLLFWRGVAASGFVLGGVLRDLERALEGFRARDEAAGAFLAWSAIIMNLVHEQTGAAGIDAWIAVFEDLRTQFPVFPTPQIEAQAVVTMLMALVMRRPYPPAIDEWAERVQRLIEASPDVNLRVHLGLSLLAQHTSTGDFVKAVLVSDLVRPLLRARGVGLQTPLLAYQLARLDWLTGAFESCRQTTEEGQKLRRECGAGVYRYALAAERAFADLSEGREDQVREVLEQLDADMGRLTLFERTWYHYIKGWSSLLRNDLDAAFVEQEHVIESTRHMGWRWPECWAHTFAAQVLCRRGDAGAAHEHLRAAAEIATRGRSHLFQFIILLTEADLAFGQGDDARGTEALRNAMAIGREKGYVNTWTWVPSTMAALCVRAMEAGIEVEYVEHLVRTRGLVPEHPPIHLDRWPWPVKVLTLGRFQILRDDKLVEFSRKTQRRPLDLLRAVIAFGAENVHEERVADALWPDADGDAAQHALATALHRLRCLLGDDRVLLRRDGRLTLDPRYCWVDVRAFDHCLTRAESAIRRRDATSNGWHASAEWTRKALALYQGHFMANEPWAAPFAERLRNRLDRHLRQLGPHCDEVPAWQERIASDGRVLAVHEGG